MQNGEAVPVKRKPGRPPGSKDKTTPMAFQNRFKGKTLANVAKLLENGDRETTLKCMNLFYGKNMPAPPITLCKIEDSESAKKALAQLIGMTAEGRVPGDHCDRLMGMVLKYLEVTTMQEIHAMLKTAEEREKDGQT